MTEAPPNDAKTILEIKDLKTYFYMEDTVVRAVDGVSVNLDRNSTLGLVGESGCGKSVTARSVMQLIQSPPGKIVGGEIILYPGGDQKPVDIVKLEPHGRAMRNIRGAEISMVFQEPMTSLNPLFTVGNQIAEAVELHQKVSHNEALERALEMMTRVQISEPTQRVDEYPHQLSGGMRQRVMIAMALSCNPAILIADEPTTALDVTVQAQILDLMRDLQRDFNSAIILITHNLGVVSQMADHVAVMYLGKIVEYSSTHNIFHDPLHPYTVGLLNSVPVFGRKGEKVLVPIKGMVPTPSDKIVGCAFAPRCPKVMDICKQEEPQIKVQKIDHQAACWLYE
jgi:peptide/nickel transport system ATP-binding protein/oligopeptide transport system ATP-binding protein